MKTLFISSQSPSISIGGIERHIKNFIDYCIYYDKDVIFLLPADTKEERTSVGRVTIIKKDFLKLSYRKVFNKKETPRAEIKKKSKDFFDFVTTIIKEEQVAIVNAQNFHLDLPPVYNLMLNMACFLKEGPMGLQKHSFIKKEMHKSLVKDLSW